MNIGKHIIIAVLVAVLALLLRLPGAGTFATVDEENWTIRSADFYHQLFRQGDPGGNICNYTSRGDSNVDYRCGSDLAGGASWIRCRYIEHGDVSSCCSLANSIANFGTGWTGGVVIDEIVWN